MTDVENSYADLPYHVIVHILSYLTLRDRHPAALTCKSWNEAFDSHLLWKSFTFYFHEPSHCRYLQCFDKHSKQLQEIDIELDQQIINNRENACEVIKKLASSDERRLTHLRVRFVGENPYFYAGQDFIAALSTLFFPITDGTCLVNQLHTIDLSAMPITLDHILFNLLSKNHPHIQHLNIQNQALICKVSPVCLLNLVQCCRTLSILHVFMCSVSEDVLLSFTEDDREPLQHLSMICRREEKYAKDISSEVWSSVVKKLPRLRATLKFDHTVPLHKVSEVMKPEIPVSELGLETFTHIHNEIRMASGYYQRTLQKLTLQTPMMRNSPELNTALVELATDCTKLRELHVYCVLEEETVARILVLHPEMKLRGTYTLKWYRAPAPWLPGADILPINL